MKTKKTTLKALKETKAMDITTLSFEEVRKIQKSEGGLRKVAVSHGTYGMNGALLEGNNTGDLYKVCARNSTLFQVC